MIRLIHPSQEKITELIEMVDGRTYPAVVDIVEI